HGLVGAFGTGGKGGVGRIRDLIRHPSEPMLQVMDRRLLLGLFPGLVGLAAGIAAAVLGGPVLAPVAATAAGLAGMAPVASADRIRQHQVVAEVQATELSELRTAVDTSRQAVDAAGRFA